MRFTQLLLILIIVSSFILRITTFQYPFEKNDSRKDHLVARHIVNYAEYPLAGPLNAFTEGKHSPVYFYFLALLLLIRDDFLFLSIENVFLQTVTIFIIYKLAKYLFDEKTALLSALIFGFNLFAIRQSSYIWLAWSMQPFINLSYLFLLLSYLRNNYAYLVVSVFLFVFAGSLHTSAFALTPFMLFFVILALRKQRAQIKHYINLCLCAVVPLAGAFIPLIISQSQKSTDASLLLPTKYLVSLNQYLPNFLNNIAYFIGSVLIDTYSHTLEFYLFTILICAILFNYLYSLKNRVEKPYSLIIIASCLLIILLISIVDLKWFILLFGSHYFTPVFGIFIILLSRALLYTFTKNKRLTFIGFFLLSIYIGIFLSYVNRKFYANHNPLSLNLAPVPPASAIQEEILTLRKKHNYKDYHFFQINVYADGYDGWKYTPTVWAILEAELETKFVEVNDNEVIGFKPVYINTPDFLFLVCSKRVQKNKECAKTNQAKLIFSDKGYSIHIVKISS